MLAGSKRAFALIAKRAGVIIASICLASPFDGTLLASHAANLPSSNGASGVNRGKYVALRPIIAMRDSLASIAVSSDLKEMNVALSKSDVFPSTESAFKKVFDEFSVGISYKQNYLDKNAFVVYYTQGFDGAGRPSIETPSAEEELQTKQYFYRNEAWIGLDDARSEVKYLLASPADESRKDLSRALRKCLDSVTAYVELSPATFNPT